MPYILDRDGAAAGPDDPARTAPPHQAPWEREPKNNVDSMLDVLARRAVIDRDGRELFDVVQRARNNHFLIDMPLAALYEILKFAEGQEKDSPIRKHLIHCLGD